jgi:hypothetical protein
VAEAPPDRVLDRLRGAVAAPDPTLVDAVAQQREERGEQGDGGGDREEDHEGGRQADRGEDAEAGDGERGGGDHDGAAGEHHGCT